MEEMTSEVIASVESKGIANLIREVMDRQLVVNTEKEVLKLSVGMKGHV